MKANFRTGSLRSFVSTIASFAFLMASYAQTTHHVTVHDYEFTPSSLTIKAGDTVTWTNTLGEHNVNGTQISYPSNPESFGNGVGTGWTFSHVFHETGTYNYQCDPHAGFGMVGEIVVSKEVIITISFSGMNPHVGQDLWLALIDRVSGAEVNRIKTMVAASFSVEVPGVETGKSYNVDFFADFNGSGSYNAPPTDHAWRIVLENLDNDTTLNFVHNTNFTDIGWKHNLTVAFSNMTPHLTQDLYIAMVDKGNGEEVERKKLDIATANFNVVFGGAIPGNSYDVDFFADHNKNGKYDAPPADHAWRLTVNNLQGDTLVPFVHNTGFTDISWKFILTVHFTGFTPHIGQLFGFYVRFHQNHEIADTVLINPLTSGDFNVMSYAIEPGIEYHIDFYSDLNGNGHYDVPPADHAWRIDLFNITGDTLINYAHNTTFTNIELETVTGVDISDNSNEPELYPNPAGSLVRLIFNKSDKKQVKIKIYNTSGHLIMENIQSVYDNNVMINLDNLKPGFYFLNAAGEKFNYTYKFIKE